MTDKIPLVSVIIPMYNAAKFIPQTLESLRCQTMKDFEVVVVDDCSTDNSVEIVNSFDNRVGGGLNLHVVKLPKNSGTPGMPRNVGMQFARGKYIAFLDSDDFFTYTALEELTTLAEKFQADVVHTNQFITLWAGRGKSPDDPAFTDMKELTNQKNFFVTYGQRPRPDKPTLEIEDISARVRTFLSDRYTREPYVCFYLRDFLITNQITFPTLPQHEDEPFAFQAMCLAKNLLNVPNIFYIVRPREGSTMREALQLPAEIHKRLRLFIDGFSTFKNIMSNIKFFNEHPDYRYAVLDWYIQTKPYHLQGVYMQVPPFIVNMFVEREFHSEEASFAAYLFNTMNMYRLQLMQMHRENNALRNELKRYQSAKIQ